MPSKFVAPKRLETFEDVRKALARVQETLDAHQPKRGALITTDTTLRAGESVRISPRRGATLFAKLPKASAENFGAKISILLERPNGTLRVSAQAPDTVVGVSATNFTTAGLIELVSNGVDAWEAANELPSTSPGGAALDAEYVLGAAHASLPNGRVATDSAEIDADLTTPTAITWALNTASVAFAKLADLAGLSVLGRATNSSGVMAAIAATAARQVLRNNDAGMSLEWEYPVGIGSDAANWEFDGVDDVVDGGDILNFERTDAFTLSVWFSTTASVSAFMLANAQNDSTARGYSLVLRNTGQIALSLNNNGNGDANALKVNSSATGFNDGSLHNVLISYDGSSSASGVAVYLDGIAIATTTQSNTLSATIVGTNTLAVGANGSVVSPFTGTLQHAAIWSSELSAAHAAEVYNAGVPPDLMALATAPDPVIWWKIDGSDAVGAGGVPDHSASGFDGTAGGGLGGGSGSAQAHSIDFTDGLASSVTLGQATVSVDVSDFAGTGLEDDGSNNLRIAAAAAGAGLTGGGGSALAVGAGDGIDVNANNVAVDVSDFAGGGLEDDGSNNLRTSAVAGAVSRAAGATASLFAGIRDNGTLETARTHLNFVSTSFDTTFSLVQDAGNDEIEVHVSTLGSFYSENSVGSIQTKFISFDDGDLLEAQVTDNTGGSGFINVTYNLNLPTDTAIANIGEGNTATGEERVSRDDMCRWLASQANVRVFEEEFFGNLAASTARFTVVSGFAGFPALSAVSNGEFTAGINLQNTSPAGTTRGVWTLGASESALNFNWDSLRYLCIVFRSGSSTVVANTQWAMGLVGPFASYGAVTASALGGTSEGVFIEYITTLSSGQFRVGRRTSSATSITSTGVAVAANTRYVYELFRTAAGVDYHYLDGTLVRTDASGIAPSGTGCTFFATILGSTTATRNFQIDAIKVVSQSADRFG